LEREGRRLLGKKQKLPLVGKQRNLKENEPARKREGEKTPLNNHREGERRIRLKTNDQKVSVENNLSRKEK